VKKGKILMKVFCEYCSTKFDKRQDHIEKTGANFCSKSCAATVNNKKFPKRIAKIKNNCLQCASFCGSKKFCSHKCQHTYQYILYIQNWKSGQELGTIGKKFETSKIIHRYMYDKAKNRCMQCGWCKIHKATKKVPLQLHHKDGNFKNTAEDNLELLCPNCHSLTDNFGFLNKKLGRRKQQCM